MNLNDMIKPYKDKLLVESVVKSGALGLLVGTIPAAVLAGIFALLGDTSIVPKIVALAVFAITATVVGIVLFKKRYNQGMKDIARRMDKAGLNARVTTMLEFQNDKSYVAKMQREDTKKS